MLHHTNNPAVKAESIANREAKRLWPETRDFTQYVRYWLKTYQQTLTELVEEEIVMKVYQDEHGWWLEPEGEVDRLLVDSLSGPWANEEAVMLASYGKWSAAHDAERRGGRKNRGTQKTIV